MVRSLASSRVLVADDEEGIRRALERLIVAEGWSAQTVSDGEEAVAAGRTGAFDLVLLDVRMPGLDGYEVCEILKNDDLTRLTPVVLVTGLHGQADRIRGIEAGADDFLSKPIDPAELVARVRSLLRIKHYTDELEQSEALILALARAIEARDPHTLGHCARLATLGPRLGERIGLDESQVMALGRGGIVHDLGKVAVPDSILLKEGMLTLDERAVMEQHPVRGAEICAGLRSFAHVVPIIRHHHERFDGSGYPDGLTGDQIPVTARVMQVVDIFDALTTTRPYRQAMRPQTAMNILRQEVDRGWSDPDIVRTFEEMVIEDSRNRGTYAAF